MERVVAGTGVGIKRRRLSHLPTMRPSTKELIESATPPVIVGGLDAVAVSYEDEVKKYGCREGGLASWVLGLRALAVDDVWSTVERMRSSSKRRAVPQWSGPLEVVLISLWPQYCSVGEKKTSGLGAETLADAKKRFGTWRQELNFHSHLCRTTIAPHIGNRSKAFLNDENNGKKGLVWIGNGS